MLRRFRLVPLVLAFLAVLGTLNVSAFAASDGTSVIFEDFDDGAAADSFDVISGGTWRVTEDVYQLSNPGSKRKANGNVSVHETPLEGDFSLSARALVQDTAIKTNDFSVLFGYKNLKNYCYASFNETNDEKTSGIFLVRDGDVRQLADIGPVKAGEFHGIRIDVIGTSVNVWRNGARVATTEARRCFGGPRRVGFGTRNDAARFDDLKVTRVLEPDPDEADPEEADPEEAAPDEADPDEPTSGVPDSDESQGTLPAQVLDLDNWKLTLPTGPKTDATEIKQPVLDEFADEAWFTVDETGDDAVVFRAPVACTKDKSGTNCGSRTSTNTLYARSELREMTRGGTANASWSATEGTHTMEVELAFEHLPSDDKPHLTGAQIHGGSDDVTTIRLEGKTLWITQDDDTHFHKITDDYSLGDRIRVKYVVKDGEIEVSYNGDLEKTLKWRGGSNYFKTGAYPQANCDNSSPCDGNKNYGEVHIYRLKVTHQQ